MGSVAQDESVRVHWKNAEEAAISTVRLMLLLIFRAAQLVDCSLLAQIGAGPAGK
jgi:hypothetical protein